MIKVFDGTVVPEVPDDEWDCPRCMDTGWFRGKPSSHDDLACPECGGRPDLCGRNAIARRTVARIAARAGVRPEDIKVTTIFVNKDGTYTVKP